MMLRNASKYDPYNPNDDLMLTMEGIEKSLPILPASDNRIDPMVDPVIIAISEIKKLPVETNEPADITKSPAPRLDQRKKKSLPDSIFFFSSIGLTPISELLLDSFINTQPTVIILLVFQHNSHKFKFVLIVFPV